VSAVASVKFSYYDYKKKEWKEEWNTMGADGLQYLPTQVRIALTVIDERRPGRDLHQHRSAGRSPSESATHPKGFGG